MPTISCRQILRNNAGAVECRRNRATGTTITLYRADEAGIDCDLTTMQFETDRPVTTAWATVCEDHSVFACHPSREVARRSMTWPEWCDECRMIMDRRLPR